MLIPFALMTASGRSQSLNAERMINLYPEKASPGSVSEIVARSTPGLMRFSIIGTGPIRGAIEFDGLGYVVSGTSLYSIDANGTPTLRGALGTITGTGFVQMAANANSELVIVNSAGKGWVWDTITLATIASLDADFGDDANSVTFLDQYLVYGRIGTGEVFSSASNNAKSYNALAFATAESTPDDVVQVYAAGSYLWVFGTLTTEVWYNDGTTPFAFARVGGAVFEDIGGVLNTVADVDQSVYWRAPDGIIYKTTGLQPQRISTHEIEHRIRDWTGQSAFAYKDEGHAFYVLSADQGCVAYDAATGLWHERDSFTVGRWRGCCYMRLFGRHLVGDYQLGIVYEMKLENHADGSNALQRRVISPPVHANGRRVPISRLQVHFEHGIGLTTGQGSDPQVILEWSDDGGKTWSNEVWASIGKIGEYEARAIWRRLGSFRRRHFRLTYSEPTPFAIYGARP